MRLCQHGVPMNTRHDCDYVDRRDALIPEAAEFADREAGPKPDGTRDSNPACEAWATRWNVLFHRRMDELWNEVRRAERAA